jgi:hypothetical protein
MKTALQNIRKMLDGSQPKDPVGAVMALDYLIAHMPPAMTYTYYLDGKPFSSETQPTVADARAKLHASVAVSVLHHRPHGGPLGSVAKDHERLPDGARLVHVPECF